MPPTALALVLVAAVLHALWNVAAKKAGGDQRFALLAAIGVTVLWAPVVLWFGVGEVVRWGWWEWFVLMASAAVHVAYFLVLLKGYRVSDLSVVYPVARGSGPLLAALGAVILLGERLSPIAMAGVLAMAFGVFLIAGGPGLWRQAQALGPQAHAQRLRVLAGLRWGALTGMLIAAYTVIDGYAVKVLLIGPVVVDYVGNVLRVPLLLGAGLRDRPAFVQAARQQWRYALVVATLGPLAYILVLYAATMAPLSHVAPAREVSMLIAAMIGGHLLGETDRGLRLVGAACMACGVGALALG
jgi:drug/metabolite transporter (DMT)-like permease